MKNDKENKLFFQRNGRRIVKNIQLQPISSVDFKKEINAKSSKRNIF